MCVQIVAPDVLAPVPADAARLEPFDQCPVQADIQLMYTRQAAYRPPGGAPESDTDAVLGIYRKRVVNNGAPTRPERQPFKVVVLREIGDNTVGHARGRHRQIPDRDTAYFQSC